MNHELNGKNGNVIIYNLRIDRYAENMIETENISYQMFLIKTREIVILARVFFAPKFNWPLYKWERRRMLSFFRLFSPGSTLKYLKNILYEIFWYFLYWFGELR